MVQLGAYTYSEGLVELKHVDVIHGEPAALQGFRGGIGGPETSGQSHIKNTLWQKACLFRFACGLFFFL